MSMVLLSTAKQGDNALGSARPSVPPSVTTLTPNNPHNHCVGNRWAYVDNCVDVVYRLLIAMTSRAHWQRQVAFFF